MIENPPWNPLHLSAPTKLVRVSLLPSRLFPPVDQAETLSASIMNLPFKSASIDAALEIGFSLAISQESEPEAVAILRELARVLSPGARYLSSGGLIQPRSGASSTPDKRRLDEWRPEGAGVWHHTVRLARPDGSWRRLHERLRVRRFSEIDVLLRQAGFTVINAFGGYSQQAQTRDPVGDSILLCERV
jgi:hypothetical protein